jgi:hypothetical protein
MIGFACGVVVGIVVTLVAAFCAMAGRQSDGA